VGRREEITMPEPKTKVKVEVKPGEDTEGTEGATGGTPAWSDVLSGLSPEQQAAYEQDVQGLKHSVSAAREERDALSRQVTEIKRKLGKNPEETSAALDQLQKSLEEANRRAGFLEAAMSPAVGCRNPKAAMAIALQSNLFKADGSPDWDAIKAVLPEGFGKPVVRTGAGIGTEQEEKPPKPRGFNDWLRKEAGREAN